MLLYKNIYIAVLNQGWIQKDLARLLTHLPLQNKYGLDIKYWDKKPIAHNRNLIVQDFLKGTDDFLMMLDGDIVPPHDILNLADFQKDIMGAVCYAAQASNIIPLVLDKNKEQKDWRKGAYKIKDVYKDGGVVECDAIGTGCMMIARHVLEDIKHPFKNRYDKNGIKTRGLDLHFCEIAKNAGYKVFANTDMTCSHWTELDLKMMYDALANNRKG